MERMKRCSTVGVTTSSGGISSHHERRYPFRIFYPDEYEIVPRVIVDVMAALSARGACGAGNAAACGSYDYRERREVHYLWPEGHPVEELLQDWLQGPAAAVAPDGGRTGDVRDRMVVTKHSNQRADLEPRTRRAVDEAMAVSLLEKAVATRCSQPRGAGMKST